MSDKIRRKTYVPQGDEAWQIEFEQLRARTVPTNKKKLPTKPDQVYISGADSKERLYMGDTQWSNYRAYINDVLDAIRGGEVDYCYFLYQIKELLRFERDDLRSRWDGENKCFEVWLNSRQTDNAR